MYVTSTKDVFKTCIQVLKTSLTSTLCNRTLKTMICMYYQLRNTYVLNSLRILLTWPQQSRHYKMQMYLHNFDVI